MRQPGTPFARSRVVLATGLGLLLLGATASCTLLLEAGGEKQCSTDADCKRRGGAFASMVCDLTISACVQDDGKQCTTDAECRALGAGFENAVCELATNTCLKDDGKECTNDAECKALGAGFENTVCDLGSNTCVEEPAQSCTNAQCMDEIPGQPAICRKNACVPVLSEDCPVILQEEALRDDNVFIVGFSHPLKGPNSFLGQIMLKGAELALKEIKNNIVGLPAGPGKPVRPVALVACNDATGVPADRGAAHLIDNVGVPAIIGSNFSGITMEIAQKQTIPKNTLQIATLATSPEITSLPDKDLVWRVMPSDAFQAVLLAEIANSREAKVRAKHGLAPEEKIRMAMLIKDDSYGKGLRDAMSPLLVLNGKPVTDAANGKYFKPIVIPTTGFDPSKSAIELTSFAPHVVIGLGTGELGEIMSGAEDAWGSTPRPEYVFPDGMRGPELLKAIGFDEDRRRRVIGSFPGRESDNLSAFRIRYKQEFGLDAPINAETSYDAMYLIAYSAVWAMWNDPEKPVTGPRLVEGMRNLLPPALPINVGPSDFKLAFQNLHGGQPIDLQGAFSPLNFDINGDAPADIASWCVLRADDGVNFQYADAGLFYDATTNKLVGELKECP